MQITGVAALTSCKPRAQYPPLFERHINIKVQRAGCQVDNAKGGSLEKENLSIKLLFLMFHLLLLWKMMSRFRNVFTVTSIKYLSETVLHDKIQWVSF